MMQRYPFTAAASAIPCPVLPDVGSISVSPGFIRPDFSASSTMRHPIRSFIDPPGLKYSHLTNRSQSNFIPILFKRTTGVLPIVSKMESKIILKSL